MITMQETFDFVVGKIREQGCASIVEGGSSCLYRGSNGTKCAAGHVIPDDKYDLIFEGCTVVTKPWDGMREGVKKLYEVLKETGHDLDLLRNLQRCHDDASSFKNFMEKFEINVKEIATLKELTYTPKA